MNFAEIWDTPGYFYGISYALSTIVVVDALKAGRMKARDWLSQGALTLFLVVLTIVTKGARNLPFVAFNQGSICHLDSVGTMHFSIDWSRLWEVPGIIKETGIRQNEMEHMGAAYMAEGLITLAGSRLYTSAAYTEEDIDDVIARFDRVFAKCGKLPGQEAKK